MMKYTKTEEALIEFMGSLEIIDCHEHLPPEEERLKHSPDVFVLFCHYTRNDLLSAGLDYGNTTASGDSSTPTYDSFFDHEIPLEKRWQTFKPWWQAIRHGSFARAARLTAKLVYGFADINDETYGPLSEAIRSENTAGIYNRMLCDRCNIRVALTQCERTDVARPLVPVMPLFRLSRISTLAELDAFAHGINSDVPTSLEELLGLCKAYLTQWKAEGTVGVKLISHALLKRDKAKAEELFGQLIAGRHLLTDEDDWVETNALESYLSHETIDMAGELDLVVAVHAGFWGDFRTVDSKHMLQIAPQHPHVRFDLYHLGMPSVRDTIIVVKNCQNVFLNLCWTHIISQVQSQSGIDELLDQVPINKVLAFGGDYRTPVEKVVGHLHMAKEDFAIVFGRRIDRDLMSFDEACEILKMWFWDNPLNLYNLAV